MYTTEKQIKDRFQKAQDACNTLVNTCNNVTRDIDAMLARQGIKKVGGMVTLNPSGKKK